MTRPDRSFVLILLNYIKCVTKQSHPIRVYCLTTIIIIQCLLASEVYSKEYLLFIDYDPSDRQRYIEQKCILSNYQAGSVPQVGLIIPGSRSISPPRLNPGTCFLNPDFQSQDYFSIPGFRTWYQMALITVKEWDRFACMIPTYLIRFPS